MQHRPAADDTLERILAAIPPASGAVVMGTGIVSIALSLDGSEPFSRILLAVASCLWVALGTCCSSLVPPATGRAFGGKRDRLPRSPVSPGPPCSAPA